MGRSLAFFSTLGSTTVRTLVGIWLFVTAGCALPPAVEPTPVDADKALATGPTVPGTQSLPIRIGVEFLPPTHPREAPVAYVHGAVSWSQFGERFHPPGVIASTGPTPGLFRDSEVRAEKPEPVKMPWNLEDTELMAIEDPFERVGVRLMKELMGDDNRRLRRDIGTPILANRHRDLSYLELPNFMDEWERDYEEKYFGSEGRRFVRRPLRKAIKSFSVFHDMDLAIEALKEDLPGAFDEEDADKFTIGRLTARLRSEFADPLEIAYKNHGFRVGSSQERLKAGYSAELVKSFFISVNTQYEYDTDDFAVRADLMYLIDERTSAHISAGDRMTFRSSPNSYSLLDKELEDGSTGLIFYVEHLF